jgi:ubiquinone/menaquinone biosynthesis C-methylase UbiE
LRIPERVHWLDVGCGTGAMTSAICAHADPASVVGCDPAEPFIEYARHHSNDARTSFVVAGAGNLPRREDGYGSITSLLALNFFPDLDAAVREMRSLTTPRGTVSACVWDYHDKMEFLRYFWNAVAAMDAALDEDARFPICRPEALAELFRAGDFRDVRCEPLEIPTVFANFDDYWGAFLEGTGPAPTYVASLDADRRDALRRKLEQTLPRGRGGSIPLTARAWAVRGSMD